MHHSSGTLRGIVKYWRFFCEFIFKAISPGGAETDSKLKSYVTFFFNLCCVRS